MSVQQQLIIAWAGAGAGIITGLASVAGVIVSVVQMNRRVAAQARRIEQLEEAHTAHEVAAHGIGAGRPTPQDVRRV